MENTLIGPESGRMERFHLVHFLDSFLDIPGAAWDVALLIYLFHSSKKGSEVRAAPRREISDLGFSSDLGQCGEMVSLRRFHHVRSRMVTKRARLVASAFRLGSKMGGAYGV